MDMGSSITDNTSVVFTQNTKSLEQTFSGWRVTNYEQPPATGLTLQGSISTAGDETHTPIIGGRILKAIQILRED
jgi:hypothetical protein